MEVSTGSLVDLRRGFLEYIISGDPEQFSSPPVRYVGWGLAFLRHEVLGVYSLCPNGVLLKGKTWIVGIACEDRV
jgi:hypothetical protein